MQLSLAEQTITTTIGDTPMTTPLNIDRLNKDEQASHLAEILSDQQHQIQQQQEIQRVLIVKCFVLAALWLLT